MSNKLSMYQRLAKSKRQKKFSHLLADLLLGGLILEQSRFAEDHFAIIGRMEEPAVRRAENMSVRGFLNELEAKHEVKFSMEVVEGVAASYWVSVFYLA